MKAFESIVSKLFRFDRVNDLHLRIQTNLVRFHLRSNESGKRILQFYVSDPILGGNLEDEFFDIFL